MSEYNYEEMGFKSGLEIHQQLDSHKLFCKCPSILRQDEPHYEFTRRLHAVAGESGEVDVAAGYASGAIIGIDQKVVGGRIIEINIQSSLKKEFVYQAYDTTCLVEMDEEPPREINKEALMIVLHIALLLNATILPISQIMRKTVINGSNTSGFQRTCMIARDGYVDTHYGKVRIDGIFLEEDSARLIKNEKDKVYYRLDRLGIPLVEISTYPDIKSPEQAKEVALFIGDVLRSCKVKRGIGTIRQDVNMSIQNGARTELKGVQDPDIIVHAMNKEIERQQILIKEGKKVESGVRNVADDGSSEFLRPMPGSDRMYPETDLPLLKISREFIDEAKKTLPKLKGVIEESLKKDGLAEEYIKILFKQDKVNLYRELYYLLPKPNFIAKMILLYPKEIASKSNKTLEDVESLLEENYIDVLNLLIKGKVKEDHIRDIFEKIVFGVSLQESIKFEEVDSNEVEERIMKIIKEKPGLNENAYMGLVMKEFKGKISGSEAMEIIKKLIK